MTVEEQLDKLISEAVVSADVLENVRNILETVVARLDRFAAPKVQAPGGKTGMPGKDGKDSKAAGDGGVMSAVQGLVGSVGMAIGAVLAFVALPPLMTAASLSFVRALNPGLVEQFDQMLSNLQATIGFGLEPIVAQAARTLREWAGMLMPMMRELRPVIADLASTISSMLIAQLGFLIIIFRVLFTALKPLTLVVGWVLRALSQLVEAVDVALGAYIDFAESVLKELGVIDDLGDAFSWLKNVVGKCVLGLAALTAALIKAVGGAEIVAKFRESLEKRIADKKNPVGGLVAAPKDVGTGSIEDIAKKMSERAFAAQTGATAKSETDLLEEILEGVKFAEKFDLYQLIKDSVRDGVKAAKDEVVRSVPGASRVEDVSSSPIRSAAKLATDPLGFIAGF